MNRWKQMRLLAAAGVLAAGLLAGPTAYATSQGLKDAKDQVTTLEQEKKKTYGYCESLLVCSQ